MSQPSHDSDISSAPTPCEANTSKPVSSCPAAKSSQAASAAVNDQKDSFPKSIPTPFILNLGISTVLTSNPSSSALSSKSSVASRASSSTFTLGPSVVDATTSALAPAKIVVSAELKNSNFKASKSRSENAKPSQVLIAEDKKPLVSYSPESSASSPEAAPSASTSAAPAPEPSAKKASTAAAEPRASSAPQPSKGSSEASVKKPHLKRVRLSVKVGTLAALRLERLATDNPKLLKKLGLSAYRFRNFNGHSSQRYRVIREPKPDPRPKAPTTTSTTGTRGGRRGARAPRHPPPQAFNPPPVPRFTVPVVPRHSQVNLGSSYPMDRPLPQQQQPQATPSQQQIQQAHLQGVPNPYAAYPPPQYSQGPQQQQPRYLSPIPGPSQSMPPQPQQIRATHPPHMASGEPGPSNVDSPLLVNLLNNNSQQGQQPPPGQPQLRYPHPSQGQSQQIMNAPPPGYPGPQHMMQQQHPQYAYQQQQQQRMVSHMGHMMPAQGLPPHMQAPVPSVASQPPQPAPVPPPTNPPPKRQRKRPPKKPKEDPEKAAREAAEAEQKQRMQQIQIQNDYYMIQQRMQQQQPMHRMPPGYPPSGYAQAGYPPNGQPPQQPSTSMMPQQGYPPQHGYMQPGQQQMSWGQIPPEYHHQMPQQMHPAMMRQQSHGPPPGTSTSMQGYQSPGYPSTQQQQAAAAKQAAQQQQLRTPTYPVQSPQYPSAGASVPPQGPSQALNRQFMSPQNHPSPGYAHTPQNQQTYSYPPSASQQQATAQSQAQHLQQQRTSMQSQQPSAGPLDDFSSYGEIASGNFEDFGNLVGDLTDDCDLDSITPMSDEMLRHVPPPIPQQPAPQQSVSQVPSQQHPGYDPHQQIHQQQMQQQHQQMQQQRGPQQPPQQHHFVAPHMPQMQGYHPNQGYPPTQQQGHFQPPPSPGQWAGHPQGIHMPMHPPPMQGPSPTQQQHLQAQREHQAKQLQMQTKQQALQMVEREPDVEFAEAPKSPPKINIEMQRNVNNSIEHVISKVRNNEKEYFDAFEATLHADEASPALAAKRKAKSTSSRPPSRQPKNSQPPSNAATPTPGPIPVGHSSTGMEPLTPIKEDVGIDFRNTDRKNSALSNLLNNTCMHVKQEENGGPPEPSCSATPPTIKSEMEDGTTATPQSVLSTPVDSDVSGAPVMPSSSISPPSGPGADRIKQLQTSEANNGDVYGHFNGNLSPFLTSTASDEPPVKMHKPDQGEVFRESGPTATS